MKVCVGAYTYACKLCLVLVQFYVTGVHVCVFMHVCMYACMYACTHMQACSVLVIYQLHCSVYITVITTTTSCRFNDNMVCAMC